MSRRQPPRMFDDVPVIGQLPPEGVAAKLQELGDPVVASTTRGRRGLADIFGWGPPKPWQHTTHQFGYLAPPRPRATAPQPIEHAGAIEADRTLRNARINIHLDRLRIYDYPGGGEHRVMFTFRAQNQLRGAPEPVSFSQTYRARQGQLAGIAGNPVFVGLAVGTLGVAFQGFTVNVKSSADAAVLDLLDAPVFQAGLNLLTTAQPALAPFGTMALGVTKLLARRSENVAVQDFYLGLDFTAAALGARLAEGNYIAAQVPTETAIDWADWVFSPTSGAIVSAADTASTLPYNYAVFRVSRYEG